jgi:hypothetical protein
MRVAAAPKTGAELWASICAQLTRNMSDVL